MPEHGTSVDHSFIPVVEISYLREALQASIQGGGNGKGGSLSIAALGAHGGGFIHRMQEGIPL